jgi:hypothetical protein
MYVQVVQPAPPPPSWLCSNLKVGCPAPVVVNPDALASILTGSPTTPLPSGLQQPTGLSGCGSSCKCGGKCGGMGDATTDPFGTSLTTLSNQLAAVNENITSSNWGTWVLVALGAVGAWYAYKTVKGGVSGIRTRVRKRRSRAAARQQLRDEERFSGAAFGDV